jgi:Predicted DNA binding protein
MQRYISDREGFVLMYYAKLLIGETEGGEPCFNLLPEEVRDPGSGVRGEVIQCTCLANDGGCAMIRITDPNGILSDKVHDRKFYSGEGGECMIDRISSHQMMAMVMNNNCKLSRILSESGCFITSAVKEGEDEICWTIVGPNSAYVHNLISKLNDSGFPTKKISTYTTDYVALLSDRQEEALRVALENGFYDIPRRVKMEGLCDILKCSKSTLDVTLRNAEKKIITHYMLQNRESVFVRKK